MRKTFLLAVLAAGLLPALAGSASACCSVTADSPAISAVSSCNNFHGDKLRVCADYVEAAGYQFYYYKYGHSQTGKAGSLGSLIKKGNAALANNRLKSRFTDEARAAIDKRLPGKFDGRVLNVDVTTMQVRKIPTLTATTAVLKVYSQWKVTSLGQTVYSEPLAVHTVVLRKTQGIFGERWRVSNPG